METNRISPENKINQGKKPVQTDSAEIVKRHLQDKNDQITEEDIRNVKIVTTDDEPITVGAEAKARLVDEADEEIEDETDMPDAKAKPGTPWDVITD